MPGPGREGGRPPAEVVVVGAGAIGQRHVQALAHLGPGDRVVVVDPDADARATAGRALRRSGGPGAAEAPRIEAVPSLLASPPIVIVATGADVRADVVAEVLACLRPKALVLEKVLFQRQGDYERTARALEATGTAAWVNHPRAMSPAWAQVGAVLAGVEGWEGVVWGRGWGLACNGLHFVERLLPPATAPAVVTSRLDPGSVPARRPHMREVTGRLDLAAAGRHLTLVDRGGAPSPLDVHVEWEGGRLLVQERGSEAVVHHADAARGWRFDATVHATPLQSELTHLVVDDLARGRAPDLPTYADVAPHHEAFVRAIGAHLRATGEDRWGDRCPIT